MRIRVLVNGTPVGEHVFQRAALVRTWTVTAPAGSYGADRFDLSFEMTAPSLRRKPVYRLSTTVRSAFIW